MAWAPNAIAAQRHAGQDDPEAEPGERLVPGEVVERLRRRGARRSPPSRPRSNMAGDRRQPVLLRHPREEPLEERRPGDIDLGRTDVGHLPVEHRGRFEVAVDDVPGSAVTPIEHAPIVGGHRRRERRRWPARGRDRVSIARPLVVRRAGRRAGGRARCRRARRGAGMRCRRRRRRRGEAGRARRSSRARAAAQLLRCALQEPAARVEQVRRVVARAPLLRPPAPRGTARRATRLEVSRCTTSGTGTSVRSRTSSITRRLELQVVGAGTSGTATSGVRCQAGDQPARPSSGEEARCRWPSRSSGAPTSVDDGLVAAGTAWAHCGQLRLHVCWARGATGSCSLRGRSLTSRCCDRQSA